jgi:hypothetical protein
LVGCSNWGAAAATEADVWHRAVISKDRSKKHVDHLGFEQEPAIDVSFLIE